MRESAKISTLEQRVEKLEKRIELMSKWIAKQNTINKHQNNK